MLDTLWSEIRARLPFESPTALTRGGDLWSDWCDPNLILSQTCGYPFRTRLSGRVQLIGAPDCRLPGCPPGHYNSVFIVRADDPRQGLAAFGAARFAYSEALSQSGWAAPQNHAASLGFEFTQPICTGGHRHSARAVADGRADIAAIDALSWRLMLQFDPHVAQLREIGRTTPTPTLPFITGPGRDAGVIRAALMGAIAALGPARRDALSLYGLVQVPATAYHAVPNPPPPSPEPAQA
ncbi:phosphate/phosphite/phosphonate ABC transporter substrate-binding protein [Roseovarius sp. M141]|uniref:phosphate/phosphite/phosphonate ABC transporter substrate-binding protein n=1 Tax=Roseovarius sp. M141 TaxID=2583806 RepID=UPI0020CED65D|nr:PhnD/SsuA/transferrin family substrate-binding protein [Roseovarius sp. M141]